MATITVQTIAGPRTREVVPMKHTEACEAAAAKYVEYEAAFTAEHPNYCRECRGWGEQSYRENQSPLGSGEFWGMDMTEPCICVEEGRCPLCGGNGIAETEDGESGNLCSLCGWELGERQGLNEGPNCACWLDEDR